MTIILSSLDKNIILFSVKYENPYNFPENCDPSCVTKKHCCKYSQICSVNIDSWDVLTRESSTDAAANNGNCATDGQLNVQI